MKYSIKYLAFTLLLLVGASSCKTKKVKQGISKATIKTEVEQQAKAQVDKAQETIDERPVYGTKKKLLGAIAKRLNSWTAMKVNWRASLQYKEESLSSKMRMEVARGKGLYLSIRPFPFVELARFWFLDKQIYLVNMMDKSYAEISYAQLSEELGVSLNYEQVEGLFTAQAVRLGHKKSHKLKDLESHGSCFGLSLTDKKKDYIVRYEFSWGAKLKSIGIRKASEKITWENANLNHDFFGVFYRYANESYKQLFSMPQEEMFYFNKERTKSLNLSLRKLETLDSAEGLNLEPKIKDSYRKMDFKEVKFLFKYLLNKAK